MYSYIDDQDIINPEPFLLHANMDSSLCTTDGTRLSDPWAPGDWDDIGRSNFRLLDGESLRWRVLDSIIERFVERNDVYLGEGNHVWMCRDKITVENVSLYRVLIGRDAGVIGTQSYYSGKRRFRLFDEFPDLCWAAKNGELFHCSEEEIKCYVIEQLQYSLVTSGLRSQTNFNQIYRQLEELNERKK